MKDRKFIFAGFVVVLVLVMVVVELRARVAGPSDASIAEVAEQDGLISAGVNKDGIPAIDAPVFTSLAEADGYLSDDQEGLAVTLGNVTRFYPYQILVWHEAVNDSFPDGSFAGEPILITYCALCDSGAVYRRTLGDGQVLDFGLSGQVKNANSILYDRQTDSRWTQLLGTSIQGDMKGTELDAVPSRVMTWVELKKAFPNAQVLSKETGFVRDYTRNPYFGYEEERRVMFPLDARDDRLHPKEQVYGYVGPDGQTAAYPLTYLELEGELVDEVEGRKLTITYGKNGISAVGENALGEKIDVILHPTYWYVWYAFFPETQLYDPIGDKERAEKIAKKEASEKTEDAVEVEVEESQETIEEPLVE